MISAIVLAAGQSKRMGQNKLLMRFGVSTVLETIVEQLHAGGADEIIIVVGHQRKQIEALLSERQVQFVFNSDYVSYEMLPSIQSGLRAISGRSVNQAALLVLGDQPLLKSSIVRSVVEAYEPGAIIIPSYRNRRGHPILLDQTLWPHVLALPPEASLRAWINSHVDRIRYVVVESDSVLRDMDTPQDYESMRSEPDSSSRENT